MVKSFKFLLQFVWINLASLLGFAAVVTLGALATGVPNGAENLFRTYFGSFPIMSLIMVFIFAIALCSSNLNVALSFGGRRRDYFWAVQGTMLVYAGTCWLLQAAMSAIPVHMHWSSLEDLHMMMSLGRTAFWLYPLVLLTMMCLGCLCGLLTARSKIWGSILFVVALLAVMTAMVLLALFNTFDGFGLDLWGILPLVIFLVVVAVFAVSEVLIWRAIRRFVVR